MVRAKIPGRLQWLWSIVLAVAVAEMLLQWQIFGIEPDVSEWKDAARAIAAEKQESDLLVIAPDWAIQGRMFLGSSINLVDLGRFDTTRYDRVFEVSVGKARAPETEGLICQSEAHFGRIAVRRCELSPRAEVLYDFTDRASEALTRGIEPPSPIIAIDHWFHPRFVVPVPLKNKDVSLTFAKVPLDGVLRGYGIIDYRNARFNEGGPITLSVFVNDKKIGEDKVQNFGPLHPFEFPVFQDGVGTVRFEIRAKDGLTRLFGFAADVRRQTRVKR